MATTMGENVVIVEEPAERAIVRHPTDLLRLIIALVATVLGFFLATTLNNLSEAITVEVIQGFDSFPNAVVMVFLGLVGVLGLVGPFVAFAYFIRKKQWRRLRLALLAVVLALVALWLLESFLVSRFSAPVMSAAPPSWVCAPGTDIASVGIFECVTDPDISNPLIRYGDLVALTAFFSAVVPYLNRRWKRFGWITIILFALTQMLDHLQPPTDEFLAIGVAYAIGAAVLLAFGEPNRRPRGRRVVEALERSGISLAALKRAGVDARGSVPYFAKTTSGQGLFVKVLSPDERAADVMFRVTRMFRLKGVGDERPFSSLKRAVEHEAVASLMASADGVKTPQMEAVADIPPSSMLMAYDLVDGKSLDSVPVEDLTDDVLEGVWRQVLILREHRVAHRDLRLANVFLGSDGQPWLIDFGFAELAATEGQLRSDIAELITSTASSVGAERAVSNAVAVLGKDPVADASSRIQPLALSGATRDSLKKQKGLDEQIRNEIQRQTGIEEIQLEKLERIPTRTVLMVVGFALAIYFLIPQLTQTDFGAVLDANWAWTPAILLASFITYVGAAYNIMGSVPDRVRLIPTTLVQLAGSFVNRISPVKVGGMATNVRFLQKNGVELPNAVAGIGVASVATMVVHMTLLVTTVVFLGRNAGDFIALPSGQTVLIGMVVVFSLLTIVYFLPPARKVFRTKVWPSIKASGQGLVAVASTPSKAVMLFGGAFVLIVAYISALWFSLEAFGGGLSVPAVALVFLGGQALGNLAPTPGGIGATEAAIIAAMTALGLDSTTAVSATFLYRIATFWLPILPGVVSFRKLEADGML
jgi:glycosyltransferase 2 family protein